MSAEHAPVHYCASGQHVLHTAMAGIMERLVRLLKWALLLYTGRLLAQHRPHQGKLLAPARLECGDSTQKTRLELKCQYFTGLSS